MLFYGATLSGEIRSRTICLFFLLAMLTEAALPIADEEEAGTTLDEDTAVTVQLPVVNLKVEVVKVVVSLDNAVEKIVFAVL